MSIGNDICLVLSEQHKTQIMLAIKARIKHLGDMYDSDWALGRRLLAQSAEVFAIMRDVEPHNNPKDKRSW